MADAERRMGGTSPMGHYPMLERPEEFDAHVRAVAAALVRHAKDAVALSIPGAAEGPKVRSAIRLTPAQLDRCVGRYELAPGLVVAITREGDRLLSQATGQPSAEIFPESESALAAVLAPGALTSAATAASAVEVGSSTLSGRATPSVTAATARLHAVAARRIVHTFKLHFRTLVGPSLAAGGPSMASDTRFAKRRGLATALSLSRLRDVALQRLLTARAGSPRDRFLRGAKTLYRRSQMAADNVLEFQDLSEHEKMLADRDRVDTYERGIRTHIRPGDVVVDLGTGTGVLAILASRIARKVYAVDRAEIIEVARHVARHHGVTNIEFVKVDSRYFSPQEKVDVILHEQIGDELYDENIIENVTDLRDRILKPGGRIVPARFELYLEPAKVKDVFSVPFMWQMQLHGIDFGCVKDFAPAAGTALTRRWDLRWLNRLELDYLLCRPEPICRLDLSSAGARDLPHGVTMTKRVVHAGRLDGLFMYVKVIFDEETWLETSAGMSAPSWGNRFFRLPARPLEAGDALELDITMPDVRRVRTWDVRVH